MSAVEPELGYLEVLRLPYARRIFGAALVGRLSFATVTFAILLAVQRSTGSYALAGAAAGAFGLVNVLVAPARARLVDRFGQRVALPRLAAVYAVLICVLAGLTLPTLNAPGWVLVAVAGVVGGCPPPLGAAMRVLWAKLADNRRTLTRAYSLDAVAEELLFVVGPVLVGVTAAVAHPAYALVGSAGLVLLGTLTMTRAPVTVGPRPPATRSTAQGQHLLRRPGFRPLLLVLFAVGVVLGTVEITVTAFSQQHHSTAVTGLLLALLSLGSVTGGLLYGQRGWRQPPAVRLVALGAALSVSSAALAAAQQVLVLAALLIVVGLFLAPSFITGYLLADDLSPASARTEASSWTNSATHAGAAASAAAAGVLVDQFGTTAAFAAGAGIATLCVLLSASRIQYMATNQSDSIPTATPVREP